VRVFASTLLIGGIAPTLLL